MAVERRRATGSKRVAWRFTVSRLLVLLRLADPTERDAHEMAVHRYITSVGKCAKRLRLLPEKAARRRRWAAARLDRAADRAVEYAGLADDPVLMAKLMRQIEVMYSITELATIPVESPWRKPAGTGSRPRMIVRRGRPVVRPRMIVRRSRRIARPRIIVRRTSGRLDASPREPSWQRRSRSPRTAMTGRSLACWPRCASPLPR
jgi:hypothetical protein